MNAVKIVAPEIVQHHHDSQNREHARQHLQPDDPAPASRKTRPGIRFWLASLIHYLRCKSILWTKPAPCSDGRLSPFSPAPLPRLTELTFPRSPPPSALDNSQGQKQKKRCRCQQEHHRTGVQHSSGEVLHLIHEAKA